MSGLVRLQKLQIAIGDNSRIELSGVAACGFVAQMRALVLICALAGLAGLPAMGQKLDGIDFFKGSTGIWTGKGGSVLGPAKKNIEVIDVWKGQLVQDGEIFDHVEGGFYRYATQPA